MTHLPSGTVTLVDLPGSGSLFSRTIVVYKKLLPQLLSISLLLVLTGIINFTLTSFLHFIVRNSVHVLQSVMEVLGSGLYLVAGGFYSLLFTAGVIMVKEYATKNKILKAGEAITLAQRQFLSVFWVGVLVALVGYAGTVVGYWGILSGVYGAALAVILPALFAVWYYFAAYIIVTDDVRGIAALAKSHYLARGLWWKIVGRAGMLYAVYALVALVAFLLLAIPNVGWLLCLLLVAALVIFAFPFQLIYDLIRFEDLIAVPRNRDFLYFKGERTLIMCWVIIGALFIGSNWAFNLLGCDTKARVGQRLAEGSIGLVVKLAPIINDNTGVIYKFLNKITYTYPACTAPAGSALPLEDDGSLLPAGDEVPVTPTVPDSF